MSDYMNSNDSVSLFQKLHLQLAEIIESTPAGEKLKSEPELAASLGVSRATLREAMRTFEGQGLIRRRQGVGTFVLDKRQNIETGLEILESIETQANRLGMDVKMGYLGIVKSMAGPELAYLIDILPDNTLSEEELERGFTGSVLDLIIKSGTIQLSHSKTYISAIPATSDIAKKVQLQRGDVIQKFEAYLIEKSGRVIDYSESYFVPGFFKFHVNRKIGQ